MASHEVLYCYSSLHISDMMASHEVLYYLIVMMSFAVSPVMLSLSSHEGRLPEGITFITV